MIEPGISVIFLGLASAVAWGAGDFSGGLASRRTSVFSVVLLSQFVSLVLLILGAFLIREGNSSLLDIIIGGLAGICAAAGLVALYSGLARGPMGVVAPVTGVVAAIIPVLFGISFEGFPDAGKIIGFIIALIAVWLVSQSHQGNIIHLKDLVLPIFAGLGFGIFYILIDQVSDKAIFWPLVSARSASIIVVLIIGVLNRKLAKPSLNQIPIICLAGIFDTGGNVFYALASSIGRLDISAVLSSLYPSVTVLLAWVILKEKLTLRNWIGVLLAMIAVILISI
jgi:drug/metabolite transporter (DMT)-like permease